MREGMSDKLPALKPRQLVKILKRLGFEYYRQKGAHRIFVKGELQVVVPMHNRDLKRGTLRNIIKGIGLSLAEFKKATRE